MYRSCDLDVLLVPTAELLFDRTEGIVVSNALAKARGRGIGEYPKRLWRGGSGEQVPYGYEGFKQAIR